MAWRPAQSLVVLKSQLDAAYPGWLFLGFIGDAAHASVPSDHNPNAAGVVCALDIGPGGGLAIHELANNLLSVRHPDLKYIISNYRIAGAFTGWSWTAYYGADPHDTHIHVSVGVGPDGQSTPPYDDTNEWNVGGEMKPEKGDVYNIINEIWGRKPNPEDYGYTNMSWHDFIYGVLDAYPWANRKTYWANLSKDDAAQKAKVAELQSVLAQVQAKADLSDSLQKKVDDLLAEKTKDEETGNSFIRWIGRLFKGE